MASLVQDLLLLARLDSGDSVELERVELDSVVVDSCSGARVTVPDKTSLLEVAEDGADIEVLGNQSRTPAANIRSVCEGRQLAFSVSGKYGARNVDCFGDPDRSRLPNLPDERALKENFHAALPLINKTGDAGL